MYSGLKYNASEKMLDVIGDNFSILQVMGRFGISPGFGDSTVQEVCDDCGVDCPTFLSVINLVSGGWTHGIHENVSVASLLKYLKMTHEYFLEFSFPAVKKKIVDAVSEEDAAIRDIMVRCFDDYVEHVKTHMNYEEETVFRYVEDLLEGHVSGGYTISTFSGHHDQVGEKLTEFKNIFIRYCPVKGNVHLLNSILFDIFACEKELDAHCAVEDLIFVPAVLMLEREVMSDEK